jgi:hypothetical protein
MVAFVLYLGEPICSNQGVGCAAQWNLWQLGASWKDVRVLLTIHQCWSWTNLRAKLSTDERSRFRPLSTDGGFPVWSFHVHQNCMPIHNMKRTLDKSFLSPRSSHQNACTDRESGWNRSDLTVDVHIQMLFQYQRGHPLPVGRLMYTITWTRFNV